MNNDFIQHLKTFRAQRRYNQAEMAAFIGIKKRTYQTIEKTGEVKKVEVLNIIKDKTSYKEVQKIAHNMPNNSNEDGFYYKNVAMEELRENYKHLQKQIDNHEERIKALEKKN